MNSPCCPTCGQPRRPDPAAQRESRVRQLADACREQGHMVTVDGRVREDAAAAVLGLAPGTLRNWAYIEQPLPFTRVARRRFYKLADLVEFLGD